MNEAKLKHLELIQSVVSRQAQNSFQAKSWSIVLLAGLAGLSRGTKEQVVLISLGVVAVFWLLDAYYLSKERLYRNLYERVAQQSGMNMSLRPSKKDYTPHTKWLKAALTPVQLLPYGGMIIAIIIVALGV